MLWKYDLRWMYSSPRYDNLGNKVDNQKCPFCRTAYPKTEKEQIERLKKRLQANDALAIYNLGVCYSKGLRGYPQDSGKALELWHQAGDVGYARANTNISYSYEKGEGVEIDMEKAKHYYEQAAIGGDVTARHCLGNMEVEAGNTGRALKHFLLAVGGGDANPLKQIRILYSKGHATIDDDTKALRLYQAYLEEIKSVQRDKAAAADKRFRYYDRYFNIN